MNIVTPIPTTLVMPTANPNTESARRDNVLRETIPQSAEADQSSSQKGLGSDTERARTPGQQPAPLTYERPQIQSGAGQLSQSLGGDDSADKDNASDESAGKQAAQEQQREAVQQEVEELKARDQEVRTHEQAHAAVGGQYAGSPQYEFTQGPDGRRYVTDGEVSIDISEAQTPEQTLKKMQQVRSAALAPAQPSSQDLKVAAEAGQKAFEARLEIAEKRQQAVSDSATQTPDASTITTPSLDDIVDRQQVSPPTRALDDAILSAQDAIREDNAAQRQGGRRSLEIGPEMAGRISVIQRAYNAAVTPASAGFQASA
ncbi:putative metalloprotease CJM1_0395 family protein [Alteromonas sp. CYL-A6]|uniref:putative metalloprotease CJM1_0395 family protein n=1 Tax=Alteromonas nitratireducens TaxID=3390813 RepID=UPI0034AF8662